MIIPKLKYMETNKIEVFNPIHLHNTVGEELLELFSENNYSPDILKSLNINFEKPKEITKLSKVNIANIAKSTNNEYLVKYLINFQEDYKVTKNISDTDFKILKKIYKKVKHLEDFIIDYSFNGMDKLEDISIFLEIEDEKSIFDIVKENIALYKISNFVPDDLNLYAWLKKGERDFKKIDLPKYNYEALKGWIDSGDWKQYIRDFNYFNRIPEILANFGVAVILTPYLEKTVFGCVRWFDNQPLIQLSDKGKNLANLWYVLFHEIGHVIKHENDEIFEGTDISKTQVNKKEKEANEFANEYLFNGDSLRKYIFAQKSKRFDDSFVELVSKRFNVDELFVALWAQKADLKGISYSKYFKKVSFK